MTYKSKAAWSALELVRSARMKGLLNACGHGSNLVLGMSNGDRSTASGVQAKLRIERIPSGVVAVHVVGVAGTRVRIWDASVTTAYKDYTESTHINYWVTFLLDEANRDEILEIWVEKTAGTVSGLVAIEGKPPGGTLNQPVVVGD